MGRIQFLDVKNGHKSLLLNHYDPTEDIGDISYPITALFLALGFSVNL